MSDESVFSIKQRVSEAFRLHGTVPPEPIFGEGPGPYRARVLTAAQHLLPRNHVWAGVNIRRQPESAFDAVERAIVHDRVAAFKAPRGELREVHETCPRTNRVVTKFYGDPEECWKPFKCVARRLTRINGELGTGENSPQARAAAEAGRHEQGLAFQALAEKRAAIGIRE